MATIVLLHPFPVDASFFDDVVPTLEAAGHEVLRPDLPGFGARVRVPGWTINEEADRLAAQIPAGCAVVGLSLGGYLALSLVTRHPDRVGALVLADTRAEGETLDGVTSRCETAATLRSHGSAAFLKAFVPRALGPSPRASVIRTLDAIAQRQGAEAMADAILAIAERDDYTSALAAIGTPTLVIVGEHDVVTPPAIAVAMAVAIPGASLAIVGGAGHMTALEEPTEFAELVLLHLA
ncbi:MAG: alpha/beta fold hydrolase [Thermoleophilia bacterium]|nr:alpha/beta fold hydrolase [Thermoleophilia bacterium]